MEWEEPSFVVVEMNAEIGAYQGDFEGDDELVVSESDIVGAAQGEAPAQGEG